MKVNKKRLLITLVICTIAAAIIIRLMMSGAGLPKSTSLQLDIASDASYRLFAYDKYALLVSGSSVRAFNTSGREVWKIDTANTSPFACTAGKYLLIGEQSGKSLSVYSGNKELYSCNSENSIIFAKTGGGGYTAIISEEAGYKGLVTVHNRKGAEIFKWHSGEGYVIDAALSDDNRFMAVAQMVTDREKVASKLIFFDIEKNEQIAFHEREDSIAARVEYRSGGWVVVTDSELLGFAKGGKPKYEVSFQGRTLTDLDISNPNNMVFALLNGQNNTVLEMYDKNGNMRGSYSAAGELKNLSVEGEVILCNQLRTLIYIDPSGRLKKTENVSHDIKSLKLFSDRKHVLVMGGSVAEVIKIR